ncbi:MAG: hypothetical protein U5L11_04630 [Arhodomonas sp.]|nr:hypothetical protein [Arhodomonas sp.]
MKPLKTLLTTLAVGLTFATAQPALSALPDAGDDNGMPSLAPLVEEVSPAVVNIVHPRHRGGPAATRSWSTRSSGASSTRT